MFFLRTTIGSILHTLVNLLWGTVSTIIDTLSIGVAYIRLILKRSGLWAIHSIFSAATGGDPILNAFRYNRVLDNLGWANRSSEPWGFDPEASSRTENQGAYLKAAAQTLLLNAKNGSSFGHSFHVLSPSQLPVVFALTVGLVVLFILLGLRSSYHDVLAFAHCFALAAFASVIVGWILMAWREEIGGAHTLEVQQSFRIGIVLFITSEFMLFFAFFWAYFHFCLNPSAVTNGQFIAEGVVPFFWYRIPLVNTVILLSSGISLTLAHGLINLSDRVSRARQWQQVLVQGVFIVRNADFNLVSSVSETLRGRLDSLNLSHEEYDASVVIGSKNRPFSDALLESTKGVSADQDQAYATFRWSDESCLNSAVGYSLASAHAFESPEGNCTELFLRNHRIWVLDTIIRGGVFLTLQAYEYISGLFTISDSVFGGVFYSLTGLHGLHVFVGVIMLMGAYLFESNTELSAGNLNNIDELAPYTPYGGMGGMESGHLSGPVHSPRKFTWWYHRVAFDGVAWYWHFVDVVWLFVFLFVYWYAFPTNYLV